MTTDPPVRVRRASRADSGRVAGLRHAWSSEQAGRPLVDDAFEVTFEEWFAREHEQRVTWLAVSDEATTAGAGSAAGEVGMLNLLVFTRMPKPERTVSRWGYVANVFVMPEWRNAGVGRLLLDAAVAHAREQGFVRLVLSPSERSVPFYARAGFRPATSLMVHPLE
ncbi:MAG TPA: GNAT family N-acetyltransferase [Nocardioidaceae bacterium]|nr:GNAT family N-acetyltransferase [Nocardioidaceae bacterium]